MSFTDADMFHLLTAVSFAVEKHDGTHRKNSQAAPYVTHPIAVAKELLLAGVDDLDVLRAAILHDVVEDTGTSLAELAAEFGEVTARLVSEVSDDCTQTQVQRKKAQIEHAATASRGAAQIKLADTLNNVESLVSDAPRGWSLAKIQGYMVWKAALLDAYSGANETLENRLQTIFDGLISFGGTQYPAIPSEPSRAEQLDAYYKLLESEAVAKSDAALVSVPVD